MIRDELKSVRRVLVLGGYGNFGKRISESLSVMRGIVIIIAGRNIKKAEGLCLELSSKGVNALLEPAVIDIEKSGFIEEITSLSPDLVIHTGGPFQGQSYVVPDACIAIGSHYIDLADDRRFVCDITSLNDQAKANNVLGKV